MLRSALRLLACVLMIAAAACSDPCRDLANQICVCLPDDGTRAACNQRAKEQEASFNVRPEDAAFCQHQLDTGACDCRNLATPEGRVGCGLSFIVPP
jgi:hypothetical protein